MHSISLRAALAAILLSAAWSSAAAAAGAAAKTAKSTKTTPAGRPAAPRTGGRAPIADLTRDPYQGAILLDAATGDVLFQDRADARGYPASMLKLMGLLIILEQVEAGKFKLDEAVRASAEAAGIGGSQVYLTDREEFPLEEMLYALMIQSANDVAVALAGHVAGSRQGFVALMNRRAQELGMTNTVFRSVHGLPPAADQEPDVTTPRDFALLCRELLKHPAALRYTAARERSFRPARPFVMRNHNGLLWSFEGCDGLKTGYFRLAGYSMAATAKRGDARVIAVVMGCRDRKARDARAAALLAEGLTALRPAEPPAAPPAPTRASAK